MDSLVSRLLLCAACVVTPVSAQAELKNTFRMTMYNGALADCRAQTYRNTDPVKYAVFWKALEQICACEATMDAANVTPDEFKVIAATDVYPPSFRARKDGYVKWCISIYVE